MVIWDWRMIPTEIFGICENYEESKMDKEKALEIISMIANGIDPYGEKEPSKNLPEYNPVTMRAVCTAIVFLLNSNDREELASKYQIKKLADLIETVSGPLKQFLQEKEKKAIRSALLIAEYKETRAAEMLGIQVPELKIKIKEYALGSLLFAKNYFYEYKKSGFTLDQFLERIEIDIIRETLIKANFIRQDAAQILGISPRSLRYKMDTFNIDDKFDEPKTKYMEKFHIESLKDFIRAIEKETILEALKLSNLNKTIAAELLGITFRSLRYRIEQYGIGAE